MGLCEYFGCAPSELGEKHPNLTTADRLAIIKYVLEKETRSAEAIVTLFRVPG